MTEISTVNVLECVDGSPIGIRSFTDNDDGNKDAERVFEEFALQNGAKKKDLDDYLDDGVYEASNYSVFLIHSSGT